MLGNLWSSTRSLHHACEQHPVGEAMANGNPPMQWYVDWLFTLKVIHTKVDDVVPDEAKRVSRIEDDMKASGLTSRNITTPVIFAEKIKTSNQLEGAAYVLTGAHLMGGEIMKRRLIGYPTQHLEWESRTASLEYLKSLRVRGELSDAAIDCFNALLFSMEEILDQKNSLHAQQIIV